jgi:hypothetical protein
MTCYSGSNKCPNVWPFWKDLTFAKEPKYISSDPCRVINSPNSYPENEPLVM